MVGRILALFALLQAMPAAASAKGICQEGSPRARVIYDHAKDRIWQPFYRDREAWGITVPGPLAEDDDGLYVADVRIPPQDRSAVLAVIHRLDPRKGDHQLHWLPIPGKITALLTVAQGVLWGVLAEVRPDPGGGRLNTIGGDTLFAYRWETGEYKVLLQDARIYSLRRLGDRVFFNHYATREAVRLTAFGIATGGQVGTCALNRPESAQACQGLRGELDQLLPPAAADGKPNQITTLSYVGEDRQRHLLVTSNHEGPGDFHFDPIPSGEVLIVFQSEKGRRTKQGYDAFLLGPAGERLGRTRLGVHWDYYQTQYDPSSKRLIRTCLDPGRPLRVYQEELKLLPWKD